MNAGVRGARIGVDEGEWADASADVARVGREALSALERQGATLVPVKSELFRHAARIGYLTIAPESLAFVLDHWHRKRGLMNDDLRVVFAVVEKMGASEVLDAQRLRSGLRIEAARVLREVDVLALPTTAITAPRYTEKDERSCFSDAGAIDGVCRFAFLGNLTGLPALTAPVGVDGDGLPIGLQLVGDAWDEAALLAISAHLERAEIARVVRPQGAVDLLA
jgi:aspartyl-tRNA(Asn)/glutamyl-tRNA(Gln) amidotransferase subunit A